MKKLENNLKLINETVLNYYKKEEYEKVTLNSKMKARHPRERISLQ